MNYRIRIKVISTIVLLLLFSSNFTNGQEIPDLEFWGIYIVVNDKPFEFKDQDARDLSMHGNLMKATMNIKSIKGSPFFNDPNAYFITYGNKMNPSKGKEPALSELVWDYQVNRYVVKRNIPIKIGPVKDLSDAFKFIPEEPLKSGIYAFHSGRLNATDPFSGTIEANERKDVWTFIITGQSDEAERDNMEQMIREHEMLVVAEEIRKANKPVMKQWLRLKSVMQKQKDIGSDLVRFAEENLGKATPETESLKKSIDEFESFYLTEKLLINEEAFISFKKCYEQMGRQIGKVLRLLQESGLNENECKNILAEQESNYNRYTVERRKYDDAVFDYNLVVRKLANEAFVNKYPELGKKCLFRTYDKPVKAPPVKF